MDFCSMLKQNLDLAIETEIACWWGHQAKFSSSCVLKQVVVNHQNEMYHIISSLKQQKHENNPKFFQ